jgi:hypothetical protein
MPLIVFTPKGTCSVVKPVLSYTPIIGIMLSEKPNRAES